MQDGAIGTVFTPDIVREGYHELLFAPALRRFAGRLQDALVDCALDWTMELGCAAAQLTELCWTMRCAGLRDPGLPLHGAGHRPRGAGPHRVGPYLLPELVTVGNIFADHCNLVKPKYL